MINKKTILWFIGIWIITILIINSGWSEIKNSIMNINPPILLALALLQLFTLALTAYQWFFLLSKKSKNLSYLRILLINLSASFVESVTPSSKLGGEAAKVYLLRKETSLSYQSLATIVMTHKYFSLLPFIILCMLALIISSFSFVLPTIVYISFLAFFFLFIMIFYIFSKAGSLIDKDSDNKIFNKITGFIVFIQRAISQSRKVLAPNEAIFLFLISLLVWILYPVKLYIISLALGFELSFVFITVVTYTAYLISILPLTPGGLGTFEGSAAFIFSLNAYLFAEGMAAALMLRLITFWFPLILQSIATAYFLSRENINLFSKKQTE
ncbi:lysylphosphatidylglycerol synthase transmembrane domain-containing protein [Natronospora cellulosivora (SeqCode)]